MYYTDMYFLALANGRPRNNDSSTQILVSKYDFPLKGARAPWRNDGSQCWKGQDESARNEGSAERMTGIC